MGVLTKAEKVEAAASIYEMMLAGETDDKIISTLGMTMEVYMEARSFMLESKASENRTKPREHVYVEYVLEQRGNIRQIDTLITALSGADGKKHYNAFVGALRLRADICDRILQTGYELGIVKKTAERHELVGGIAVAAMSREDLMAAIGEMGHKAADLALLADVDISMISPGPLHRGVGMIDAMVEDDAAALDALGAPPEARTPLPPSTDRLREGVKRLTTPPAAKAPAAVAHKALPPKR